MRFMRENVLAYKGPDCIEWPYSRNNYGYGKLWVDGRLIAAHRFVCETMHGPAPSPVHEAAHSCGRGHLGCVTPAHISWKTRLENESDKFLHGTSSRGSGNAQAKLTEETVLAIKALEGSTTQRAIAKRFGISFKQVNDIYRGKSWSWLSP